MYINCISCGHKFDVGKSYDDYEGPVRCPTCRALLEVRTQDGSIRSVRPFQFASAAPQPTGVNDPVAPAETLAAEPRRAAA
jgi:DNA-directed RNA polymerase subunit RPC12/RpoP